MKITVEEDGGEVIVYENVDQFHLVMGNMEGIHKEQRYCGQIFLTHLIKQLIKNYFPEERKRLLLEMLGSE